MACGFPQPAILVDDATDVGSFDSGVETAADAPAPDALVLDALAPDAFVAPPLVTAFSPNWGSTSGGTRVRVLGFGFTGPGLVVKVGPAAATNVTVVSDTELTLTAPVGPHAPVDLVVTTQGGMAAASNKYRYLAPLYAADARGITPGNLYIVNPTNAVSVTVGPLGVAVTGLALSAEGVLYGATVARSPAVSALVIIDPYTARVTTIGPLATIDGDATNTPDLAFIGPRLFGLAGTNIANIDIATARVRPINVEVVGGGLGLASPAPDTLFVSQGPKLVTAITAKHTKIIGPKFSRGFGSNSLTYVGGVLFGAEATSTAPVTTLVTIDPTNAATTVVGQLPNNVDAIAGIPGLPVQTGSSSSSTHLKPMFLEISEPGPPILESIRIATREISLRELLAYGRDVESVGAVTAGRRIVPISSLGRVGLGDRIVLVSRSGDTRVVMRSAAGLALTASRQRGVKLIDVRNGFQRILGEIVEIRTVR